MSREEFNKAGDERSSNHAAISAMTSYLTGRYVDKAGALEVLHSMNGTWTKRQIDWTAEPDAAGNRKWPWFLDAKGVLRIDEGFIRAQFDQKTDKSVAAMGAIQL